MSTMPSHTPNYMQPEKLKDLTSDQQPKVEISKSVISFSSDPDSSRHITAKLLMHEPQRLYDRIPLAKTTGNDGQALHKKKP